VYLLTLCHWTKEQRFTKRQVETRQAGKMHILATLLEGPSKRKREVLAFVEIKVQASYRHAELKVDGCSEKYSVGLAEFEKIPGHTKAHIGFQGKKGRTQHNGTLEML
jgi:hypothetical protein